MSSSIQGKTPSGAADTVGMFKAEAADTAMELAAEQASAKSEFQTSLEDMVNPLATGLKKAGKTEEDEKTRLQRAMKMTDRPKQLGPVERSNLAQEFNKKNPEFIKERLLTLHGEIKEGDSVEEILKKVLQAYPDVSMADDALDFLIQTTPAGPLEITLKAAKEELNTRSRQEIVAGKNIYKESQVAGVGTPSQMRDQYRKLTKDAPPAARQLYDELSQEYGYNDLVKVTAFFLHALGAETKVDGPSIPNGKLHELISKTKSVQAILGVYKFFKGRMGLVDKGFAKLEMPTPSQINFESMTKEFMFITRDAHPPPERMVQSAVRLGANTPPGQVVVLSRFREAIKEVNVEKIYNSTGHRDELHDVLVEALQTLEYEIEDELERQGEV